MKEFVPECEGCRAEQPKERTGAPMVPAGEEPQSCSCEPRYKTFPPKIPHQVRDFLLDPIFLLDTFNPFDRRVG
jgi:nitrate reductase cytochrome c-type subunit